MDDNSHGHILTLQARRQVESHAGELVATLGSVIIMVPGFFSGSKPKDYLDHPWWWACALLEGSTRGRRPATGPTGAARWGLQSRCDSTAASGVPRAGCRHRHEKRRHPRDAGPTGGGQ